MKGRQRTGGAYLPGQVPAVAVMAVLGCEQRCEIVRFLAERGEAASGFIADQLEIAYNTVSHHLAILRDHQLVQVEHRGAHRIYRLARMLRARVNCDGMVLKALCSGDVILMRFKTDAQHTTS